MNDGTEKIKEFHEMIQEIARIENETYKDFENSLDSDILANMMQKKEFFEKIYNLNKENIELMSEYSLNMKKLQKLIDINYSCLYGCPAYFRKKDDTEKDK